MSIIEINWHPNTKELRNFGIAALIATAVISLLLYLFKGLSIQWSITIFAFGLIIFISSIISIKLTRCFYLGLIILTFPIGYVISFLLMAVFYFLLITPFGIVFRLIGRDSLNREFDSKAKSYWVKRKPPESLNRYFQQF